MDDITTFHMKEVVTEADAQVLRLLRNECRMFMTGNTLYISEEQQSSWFQNLDRDKFKLYLAVQGQHGSVFMHIGFGILRVENDKVLLTGGVSETFRGERHGERIFRFLIDEAKKLFNKKIELDVLVTNVVAQNLYRKLGFFETSRTEKVITMEYRDDSSI